jgi:hypothetical protein
VKKEAAQLRTDLIGVKSDINATTARLEEAQKKLTESEARLRTDVDVDELRLAAAQSGHTFWYHLFSTLEEQKPRYAEIVCLDGTTQGSRLFAEKLSIALHDFGWTSPISPRDLNMPASLGGVTILNKNFEGRPSGELVDQIWHEPDAFLAVQAFMGKFKMSAPDAKRLATLMEALGAPLEKAEELNENSLKIVIGDPVKKQQTK